jgi:mannosyltransferase
VQSGRGRERLLTIASILVPALVAAALSGYELSVRSLWLDESATVAIASQHGAALWAAMEHDAGNMIAYYALMHALVSVFGDSLVVLRLPSVIGTAVTAGTVSAIGRQLFNRRVGAAAGLLTAFSLPLVYWGQDARAYALVFALVAVSFLSFVSLVDAESSRRPGTPPRWAWPAYVVALVLAMYMSFVAVLVIPAQLVSLLWYRRRLRSVASAVVVVAVCSVPLAVLAYGRGAGQLFWIPRPSFAGAAAPLEWLLGSGIPPQFELTATSLPLLALTAILLTGLAISALPRAREQPAAGGVARSRWSAALVGSWIVAPVLVDTAESVIGHSIFESRYFLVSAPAVSLALGRVLLSSRRPAWLGSVALAAFLVLRMMQILPTYGVSPENWHSAANYVLDRSRPGDCIAFYPADGRMAFAYYFEAAGKPDSSLPRPVLPGSSFADVKPYVEDYWTLAPGQIAHVAATCPRLWLVSSHVGNPRQSTVSRVHYFRFKTLNVRLESRFGLRVHTAFGYAGVIDVWLFTR